MPEVTLPPEELEPEIPEEQLPEVEKPTELSKVITVKFNPLDTGMTSTANTRRSFYTTDTDAWVVFEIENMDAPNGEYSLVLYNKSDGSIFQRTGDIVSGAAYYKIEEEEIKHAGDWVGQVVITLVNGKTTTSRFSFSVAGHLLDGKDVRQIVIQDFEILMKQLNGLKDDAEIDFRTLKNDIEESQRIAEQNEIKRQEAEKTREESYKEKVDAAIVEADVVTKVNDKVAELSPTIQNVTTQLAQTENEVIDVKNSNSKQVTSINNLLSANTSPFNEPLVTVTNALNDVKKHVAFPTMAIDGNNILVMYRRGTNHIDTPDGILVQKKSIDGGLTWGDEQTVYTPPSTFDARDPNIMQLSATKLLLIYPLVENTGQIKSVENEVWVSNDFGTTWSKIGNLPKHPTANWYQIVRGSMTKTSTGRLLIPVWVANLTTSVPEGAFIVYSDNEGVTWSVGSWITQEPVTETAIEYDNFGRLYAVMRNDPTLASYRENNMFINYSDNNGLTWSKLQELPLQGHAPHLLKLKDTILLTWRNTNKRHVNATDDRYSVNFCTLKNGAVNSQIYDMLNTGTPDCGYPWAVKNGSKVFVAFYAVMPSIVDLIYVKPLDLNRLENLEFIQPDPITYINVGNVKTQLLKHKLIMGDNSVSGNGTNLSSKFIPFGETVKGVKNVKITVLNDTSVNFITTVSGVTTSGFTVNLKNIVGTFNSAVQIYWEAVVEYN